MTDHSAPTWGEFIGELDPPPLSHTLEDYLAQGEGGEQHYMQLHAWIMLGAEAMARAVGRGRTSAFLKQAQEFVDTAQPHTPWAP